MLGYCALKDSPDCFIPHQNHDDGDRSSRPYRNHICVLQDNWNWKVSSTVCQLKEFGCRSSCVTHRSMPTVTVGSLTEDPWALNISVFLKLFFPYPCLLAKASSAACVKSSQVSGFHAGEVVSIWFYGILLSHPQQDKQEATATTIFFFLRIENERRRKLHSKVT